MLHLHPSKIGCPSNTNNVNSNRKAEEGLAAEDAAADVATAEYPSNRAHICNTALTKAVAANAMCSNSNIQAIHSVDSSASGRNPSSNNTSKGSNSSKGNTRAITRAAMPSNKCNLVTHARCRPTIHTVGRTVTLLVANTTACHV